MNKNIKEILGFLRNHKRSGIISDTDDGILFKKIQKKHQHTFVLSLTINIDGAAIYASSKNSLWLIQAYQNYLPANIRYKPKHVLLIGLFFGSKKPDVFDLMYPLAKELDNLQKTKIRVYNAEENDFHDFIPYVTMASLDLPAKQMLQNFTALNGRNSCSYCDHPGESVPNAKKGSTIRYVFRENCRQRTHIDTVKTSGKIKSGENTINGIKRA